MTRITLGDYLAVRDISTAKLAARAGISKQTITRWLTRSTDIFRETTPKKKSHLHLTPMEKVGRVLGLNEAAMQEMIANGRKAATEPAELQAVRRAMALLEFARERGVLLNLNTIQMAVSKCFFSKWSEEKKPLDF